MIYLDSCALVKLVVTEKETETLQQRLSNRQTEIVTCDLALTEVLRVVRRSCYDSQRQLRVDQAKLDKRLTAAGELLDRLDRIVVDTNTLLRAGMDTGRFARRRPPRVRTGNRIRTGLLHHLRQDIGTSRAPSRPTSRTTCVTDQFDR